ncbi:acetyltransferase [Neisseriaceae bacterium JH1-16]|nr:acetyltransferase [Neisseriaceae bacterium JH1-16]
MAKPAIMLIGAGGHARSCIDVIEHQGQFQIGGLIDQVLPAGHLVLGYPIIGSDSQLPQALVMTKHVLIAVGQIRTPAIRQRLYQSLKELGADFPVITSPSAIVSRHANVGEGTLVGHQAIINACAVIGANCIMNSRSLIEHDTRVGDHCHISTGAILNGGVEVEEGCFIGSGAIVREGIHIGAHSFIGAGSLVTRDCPPSSIIKRNG